MKTPGWSVETLDRVNAIRPGNSILLLHFYYYYYTLHLTPLAPTTAKVDFHGGEGGGASI